MVARDDREDLQEMMRSKQVATFSSSCFSKVFFCMRQRFLTESLGINLTWGQEVVLELLFHRSGNENRSHNVLFVIFINGLLNQIHHMHHIEELSANRKLV